ncbi:MAG: flavin reductase [Bacteroidales bacterium]|nr:flavin reductase [Bacteroidales bacterium]
MKNIKPSELELKVIELISKEWMLVSAGSAEKFNTMTANWGGIGFLWNKPVAFVFVRPERYTHEFTENNEHFSLTFLPSQYKNVLNLLGTKSGRDTDKIAESGLTPVFTENGTPYFTQGKLIIECKKLFKTPFNPNDFIEKDIIDKWYTVKGGFHDMYIAEIENILIEE